MTFLFRMCVCCQEPTDLCQPAELVNTNIILDDSQHHHQISNDPSLLEILNQRIRLMMGHSNFDNLKYDAVKMVSISIHVWGPAVLEWRSEFDQIFSWTRVTPLIVTRDKMVMISKLKYCHFQSHCSLEITEQIFIPCSHRLTLCILGSSWFSVHWKFISILWVMKPRDFKPWGSEVS